MVRKLASLLALMTAIVFFGSWLAHQFLGRPTTSTEDALNLGIIIMVASFLFGLFIARIGVSLLREMIAERRCREEEQQSLARQRFERVVSGETPEETPTPPAEEKKK